MMTWRPRAVALGRMIERSSADVFIYGIRKEVSPPLNPTNDIPRSSGFSFLVIIMFC
jgi:hypothetical protein